MSNQVNPKKAEALWFGNTLVKILLSSEHGHDGISIIEHRMPHGDSPPMHVHRNEDEVFHIIEGKMRFQVGQEQIVVGAGETIVAPKGVPHTFRVELPDHDEGAGLRRARADGRHSRDRRRASSTHERSDSRDDRDAREGVPDQ